MKLDERILALSTVYQENENVICSPALREPVMCPSRASSSQAGLMGIGNDVVGQYIYTIVFGENIALTAAVAFMIEVACLCFPFSREGGIPGV